MNQNHSFDPGRSAAIRQMLVRTVAQNASPAPRERTRRRFALIVSLAVVAVVLAGGSAAWALGVRPFPAAPPNPTPAYTPAPTQTPTPTPTPTLAPTPVESFDAPTTRVGIGCAALGADSLASVLPNPELNTRVSSPSYLLPSVVAIRETGYEECEWFGAAHSVDINISTEVVAGRTDIASDHNRGYTSLLVGDVSSQHCATIDAAAYYCSISVVVGNYWMTIYYDATNAGHVAVGPSMKQFVATTANRLRAAPLVGRAWVAPATSWSSVSTCADLQTSEPMSTILGLPGLSGPTAPARKSTNGIYFTAPGYIECLWNPTSGPVALDVTIDSGARWAYPLVANGGKPAEVVGADAAESHCYGTEEGYQCQLDVLSDNSWLQLSLNGGNTAKAAPQENQLIMAAQAIIAAHR
jgi:hypothetical protein